MGTYFKSKTLCGNIGTKKLVLLGFQVMANKADAIHDQNFAEAISNSNTSPSDLT